MPPEAKAAAAPPSPALIFQILNGFQNTAALKTAIELDVFNHIAQGAETAEALAQSTGCAARGLSILCDALTVFGMLEKEGDRYRLTPDSALFLDRQSPAYLGSITEFLTSPAIFEAFAQLPEAVRRGGSSPDVPAMEPDSPNWVNFARNMAPLMRMPARVQAELLLPKPSANAACKVLDIAAGHGWYGIAMAQRNPAAQVYALDWPQVLAVAQENAAQAGVASRYHLLPGSAFEVDFGTGYNWILLPNFLHHFDMPTCEALLKRVRAALAPDGEVAVLDFIVDDNGVTPPQMALFGLIMLATTPRGKAYTESELEGMLTRAGFSDVELHPLRPGFQRVMIATP